MQFLLRHGCDADGDHRTHPISASIASSRIEAVQLLLDAGADLDGFARKSLLKEYTQTPIAIAPCHLHVSMINVLAEVGVSLRAHDPNHDPMAISWVDRRSNMLLCLLKGGLSLRTSDPSPEKILELAVGQGNSPLANLMLQSGADPNAAEQCVETPTGRPQNLQ